MRHRFPISDCVLVVVCDESGRRFHSENIHRYSPSWVVSEIQRYACWKFHRDDLMAFVVGKLDSSSSDSFFACDWDIKRFLY